jgi:hypothetical protein
MKESMNIRGKPPKWKREKKFLLQIKYKKKLPKNKLFIFLLK